MSEQQALPGIKPPEESPELASLSVSKINQFLRCGLAYYFRHVVGLRTPPRSYQVFGTSLHAGIAHNYRKKMESQLDLPLGEVQEFFSADWDYQKGKVLWESGESPDAMKDEGMKILSIYHGQIAPKIQPKAVEQPFEVRFDNVGYSFKGIIDLVDTNTGFVVDHKTTRKTPSAVDVHKDLQLTAYSMGHRILFGQAPKGLRFDYMVRCRSPKVIQMETNRDESDVQRFLKLVGHVASAIKAQIFYPNPTSFCCSAKLCPYWPECEGGRKW